MKYDRNIDLLQQAKPASRIDDGPMSSRDLEVLQKVKTRAAAMEAVAQVNAPAQGSARLARVPSRRVVLLAAAAVSVVAGAGLVVADPFGSTGVAIAATPAVLDAELAAGRDGRAELRALAAKTARDTTLPGDSEATHVVRTSSWYLSTQVDGERVTSAVVPEETTLTWNSDLSGRREVKAGRPYFPDASYRKAWSKEGTPGHPEGKVIDVQNWSAGSYQPGFPVPLPSDPARLLAVLKVGHPVDVDGTGQLTRAITDVYRQTTPAPAVRSALLTVLAGRDDVLAIGSITDRAGRTGLGFAVDTTYTGLPQRHLLIFDPATGALLAEEEVLTKTAGKLNVRVPSVIGYASYQ